MKIEHSVTSDKKLKDALDTWKPVLPAEHSRSHSISNEDLIKHLVGNGRQGGWIQTEVHGNAGPRLFAWKLVTQLNSKEFTKCYASHWGLRLVCIFKHNKTFLHILLTRLMNAICGNNRIRSAHMHCVGKMRSLLKVNAAGTYSYQCAWKC